MPVLLVLPYPVSSIYFTMQNQQAKTEERLRAAFQHLDLGGKGFHHYTVLIAKAMISDVCMSAASPCEPVYEFHYQELAHYYGGMATSTQQNNINRLLYSGQASSQHLAFRLLIGSGMDEQDAWQYIMEIAVHDFMLSVDGVMAYDIGYGIDLGCLPTIREWDCYAFRYWPVLKNMRLRQIERMRYAGAIMFSYREEAGQACFLERDAEPTPLAWYQVLYRRREQ